LRPSLRYSSVRCLSLRRFSLRRSSLRYPSGRSSLGYPSGGRVVCRAPVPRRGRQRFPERFGAPRRPPCETARRRAHADGIRVIHSRDVITYRVRGRFARHLVWHCAAQVLALINQDRSAAGFPR
jgi:hypothetical protein